MGRKTIKHKPSLGGKLMFPGQYLSAADLIGAGGKDVTLTITRVFFEGVQRDDGTKERKPVLAFAGTEKKLVLNKVNASSIAALYGLRAEEWVGKRVTFYQTQCESFGETVDCIRVREKVPPARPAAAAPEETPQETPPPPAEDDGFGAEMVAAIEDGQDELAAGSGGPNRVKPRA